MKKLKNGEANEEASKVKPQEINNEGVHEDPYIDESIPVNIPTDETSTTEISKMQNTEYSREIIDGVRQKVNFEKLVSLKHKTNDFLNEGVSQIKSLWNGMHGLMVHTEMFTVLFLIMMGVILLEVKNVFKKPHEFAKWRDTNFDVRHKRWFQQAVQLAEMGNFSRKYSPLGKKRILQLEHIRKVENFKSCEEILAQCPPDVEIKLNAIPDSIVEKMDVQPFPDISYDIEGDLVKHYVDSVITAQRLKKQGINFADFEDAKIIAYYQGQAIPVLEAAQLKEWLEEYPQEERQEQFENYLMDRMRFPSQSGSSGYQWTLDKVVSDFLKFCKENEIDNDDWLEGQRDTIDSDSLIEAFNYLILIVDKLGIEIKPSTTVNNDHKEENI